ncbi:MAG: cysteine dioxygenase family protein [Candidatus Eremiobacteraeota bacterium]|nr:cysteine dioxygenase family protein [Candidatus Eremiobacteraeota bacterium]
MIAELDGALTRAIQDAELITAMRAGVEGFARYRASIPLIPQSYSRTLLVKTAAFELVAMQWSVGSVSPIHDHGNSRCWVATLEGALDVESFDRLDDGTKPVAKIGPCTRAIVGPGALDFRLNWRELHRVRNAGNASAYTLQIYAGPQSEYVVVDEETLQCSPAFPKYDSTFVL